jgi:hypothetical protein
MKENLIFNYLSERNKYTEEQRACIEGCLVQLRCSEKRTNGQNPGVLLGKIQSGKTRCFIGVLGLGLDLHYDYCIVLTKNTKALAHQTLQRLEAELEDITQDGQDIVRVYDIMKMPDFTQWTLGKKLIFVVKKQTRNLDRMMEFFQKYPETTNKRILIIDDEADYASVGFQRTKTSSKKEAYTLRRIAEKLDTVRGLAEATDFLQVTATPYALYLQPDDQTLNQEEYLPIRPGFTQLVPIHDRYVGGRVYFEALHEQTDEPLSWAKFLHIAVPPKEIEVLGKQDLRYISSILTTPNLDKFRSAIITFLVGGAIRSIQEKPRIYKCSFIIHTATQKDKHRWQKQLVEAAVEKLTEDAKSSTSSLISFIDQALVDLQRSLDSADIDVPNKDLIVDHVRVALLKGHIAIRSVNSDSDIQALLDKRGQLQLDNPFNIFVGGQILDRGITIENLLGFFYGRNPKTIQQDTVLQHSRMYGARPLENMVVTRLYTTARLYEAMKRMHEFDSALREALMRGQYRNGVVFLEKDGAGEIKPCSPNKILVSHTTTLRPHKRYLPVGFQTLAKSKLRDLTNEIDAFIESHLDNHETNAVQTMSLHNVKQLIKRITLSYVSESYDWDPDAMISMLERCCEMQESEHTEVYCMVLKNRKISRVLGDGSLSNAPDSGGTLTQAKNIAQDKPCLILTRQNGYAEDGWRDCPFWWPVIVTPKNANIAVFSLSPTSRH